MSKKQGFTTTKNSTNFCMSKILIFKSAKKVNPNLEHMMKYQLIDHKLKLINVPQLFFKIEIILNSPENPHFLQETF